MYRITPATIISIVEGSESSKGIVQDLHFGASPAGLGKEQPEDLSGTEAYLSPSPISSRASSAVGSGRRKITSKGSGKVSGRVKRVKDKAEDEDGDEGGDTSVPNSKFGILSLLDDNS